MISTKLRVSILLALCGGALSITTDANAARPADHLKGADDGELQLVDGRSAARRGRWEFRAAPVRPTLSTAAIATMKRDLGPSWVAWDEASGTPRRILTSGIEAPNTTVDPWEAADQAKAMVARQLAVLAPGSTMGDFVLVSNHESAGIRSVGFAQYSQGRPVVGGQLSVRFSHDRLVGIASEAIPYVHAPEPSRRISEHQTQRAAQEWLDAAVVGTQTRVGPVQGPFVLPMVHPDDDRVHTTEVFAVDVRVEAPDSAWTVYIDSESGDPVARLQSLTFASGTVLFNAPVRSPALGERADYLATQTDFIVDGQPQLSDASGFITFDNPTALVQTQLQGPLRTIINAAGEVATESLFIGDGGSTTWVAADNELVDAQISAFVHADIVKNRIRGIDPNFAYLDEQLQITVNIDDECNAFSDGSTINFFQSSESCANTAQLADVVYHEFGHAVHRQSLLPGVGAFDGSLSEGVSDYLSATITGDPLLARGFFNNDSPLRDLDPEGFEYHWPEDTGEVHAAGRIIGGALWDFRKLMIAKHGEAEGVRIADRIYYEATRRAVDMPSMHPEALLVDDDDGDLSNGTPNGCEINAAFGSHGLFSAGEGSEAVSLADDDVGFVVDLALALPSFPGCPVSATATLEYRLRSGGAITNVTMQPSAGGYSAPMPAEVAGQTLQYRVLVDYSVGAQHSLPDNMADPWYEIYVGPVETIYCTDFSGEAIEQWQTEGGFSIDVPAGTGSPVDPPTDYDGDGQVLGHSLDGTGFYNPGLSDEATGPRISFDPAAYSSVRLQYRRWLSVEDGVFDQAAILADGERVWENFISPNEDQATTHHTDREWRFHDVDLSEAAADGEIELGFSLRTDGGLELGGWAIDALCVVGVRASDPLCGNGVAEAGEACDDGNQVEGDGCSSACTIDDPPTGGAGSGGDGDPSDDSDDGGNDNDGASALADQLIDRGCVCSARTGNGSGPLPLALVLLLGYRRRRNRVTSSRS